MKQFDIFKDESLKMTLEESERESMKESLLAYMEKNPSHERKTSQIAPHSSALFTQKRLTQLFAFIIICLIISIGVVFVSSRNDAARSVNTIEAGVKNINN